MLFYNIDSITPNLQGEALGSLCNPNVTPFPLQL